jgi:hypothetical protein
MPALDGVLLRELGFELGDERRRIGAVRPFGRDDDRHARRPQGFR